jgi:hypothetical protein
VDFSIFFEILEGFLPMAAIIFGIGLIGLGFKFFMWTMGE